MGHRKAVSEYSEALDEGRVLNALTPTLSRKRRMLLRE
jgi:hypothetical protein